MNDFRASKIGWINAGNTEEEVLANGLSRLDNADANPAREVLDKIASDFISPLNTIGDAKIMKNHHGQLCEVRVIVRIETEIIKEKE